MRTARSKGLTERQILVRHGLRNAVGPPLSMLGLQSGLMLAGVVVVEPSSLARIGLYAAQAIPVADFPVIAGVALVIGVAYVVINAIVDVLQATPIRASASDRGPGSARRRRLVSCGHRSSSPRAGTRRLYASDFYAREVLRWHRTAQPR